MVGKLILHFVNIIAFTVVISQIPPNQDATPNSTFLSHDLRLVKSNKTQLSVQWSMQYNGSKVRMSTGKYYLDMSSDKKLIKVNGGDAIEKEEQEQQLKEIKEAIRADRIRVEGNRTEAAAYAVEGQKSTQNQNADTQNAMVEPIIEKKIMLIDDMGDSTGNMLSSNLVDNEGDSVGGSTVIEKTEKKEKASKRDKIQKTESTENESGLVHANLQSNLFGSSTKSSSNVTEKSTEKVSEKGYVFDIIPSFSDEFSKKFVIKKEKRCLTHNLMYEECDLNTQKPLPGNFYWNIYQVDDAGVLGKIKHVVKLTENQKQQRCTSETRSLSNTSPQIVYKQARTNIQQCSRQKTNINGMYDSSGIKPVAFGANPEVNKMAMLQSSYMQNGYKQVNSQESPFQQPSNNKLLLTDDLWRNLTLAAAAA
ncbi:hypothetical protein GINT2_002180 [Glugoides intestinalis]